MIMGGTKTEYRKVGPAMSRVRALAQPLLDGEWPGPVFSRAIPKSAEVDPSVS